MHFTTHYGANVELCESSSDESCWIPINEPRLNMDTHATEEATA
ncbi:MAG: hypothetical protein AAF065_13285 [Verrucomicrobiota bacterium]